MNPKQATASHEVRQVHDADFESSVIQSGKPVLVDFWADWCQPCHQIAPAVQALAEEYGDRVRVAKLNVDENPASAAKYGIRSIPALLLFKDGQVVKQMVGVRPKQEIARGIEAHL